MNVILFLMIMLCFPLFAQSVAQASVAKKIPERRGVLRNHAQREKLVREKRETERLRLSDVRAKAAGRNIPIRIKHTDGTLRELRGFRGERPLYYTTLNANAAVSTAADLLQAAPYNLDGSSLTVGVWDGGGIRSTHQEFGGRVTIKDGASIINHATHVGGTIGASGVDSRATGMAGAVNIDSYDWNDDASEMTARGASYPGEPGTIYLSNHSYGYALGWVDTYASSPEWEWHGSGSDTSAREEAFGVYLEYSVSADELSCALPYYLMFWAAGNDGDDNPANGDSVALSPGGTVVTYDSALHPPGDGVYRSGYDNISAHGIAKNVVCVGSVTDAVSGGVRTPGVADISSFSSWGPSDDGRIKPDLVANGNSLCSSLASSDTAYGYYSGTSMATPNATGTAALLIDWFTELFPGHYMRASTLKGLLLHTADDLGSVGPDYKFGWGLINAQAAAELIQIYYTAPATHAVVEDRLTTSRPKVEISFVWDGINPIRATLCWCDPPGVEVTTPDYRVSVLVNNLDLRIKGPDDTIYEPWVLPYVGNWSDTALAWPAVTGSNKTDNVEQVLITSPPQSGEYTVIVSHAGALDGGEQKFSLLLSGASDATPAFAPVVTASEPLTTSEQAARFTVTGNRFALGAEVNLRRSGAASVAGAHTEVTGDQLETVINTLDLDPGWWDVEVINPGGHRSVLHNAFVLPCILWSEDFEVADITTRGWILTAADGVNQWGITTTAAVSPTRSIFSPGAASSSDTALVSPPINIESNSCDLQLSFQHKYELESQKDGGVLEISLDGEEWVDVNTAGSGVSFIKNGYNSTINDTTGPPASRSVLNGQMAWTGSSGVFIETVVSVDDLESFAGHSLRVRWRLVTNNSNASDGWYVDDFQLNGIPPPPPPPRGTLLFVH